MRGHTVRAGESIQPVYDIPVPNCDVFIGKQKVTAAFDEEQLRFEGEAVVALRCLPTPRISFEVTLHGITLGQYLGLYNMPPVRIIFTEMDREAQGRIIDLGTLGGAPEAMKAVTITVDFLDDVLSVLPPHNAALSKAVFHLANFKHFRGMSPPVDQPRGGVPKLEMICMRVDDWEVTVSSTPTSDERTRLLRSSGGYAVTHVGVIERIDKGTFSWQVACDLLVKLNSFFSFAQGFWVCGLLPVGFDADGHRIWEERVVRKVDPWQSAYSWFDGSNGDCLASVFPGFLKLCENETWQEAVRRTIYFYLQANKSHQGVDIGVVLGQAALEILAWCYATGDRCLVTERGFKKLPASDQLRLLLSSLDIPLGIPDYLERLKNAARTNGWLDGPNAITEIRNDVVHAKRKYRSEFSPTCTQAWNLGLWYVEMVLLRLFGYSGEYSNRLVADKWVGQREKVPWAP